MKEFKSTEDIEDVIGEEYDKFKNEEKKVNVYVTGATGVGKSSLINATFGEDLAETNVGQPVTQFTKVYESNDKPFRLYDTKGYELGEDAQQEYMDELERNLNHQTTRPDDQIHLVWYCIAATSGRVLDRDLKVIQKVQQYKRPVCVVLTKCDIASSADVVALKTYLHEQNIEVFAISSNYPQHEKLDLKQLIHWSSEKLEEGFREAFIRSQIVDLELLKEEVNKKIKEHSVGAFAVGFVPIPFADSPVLITNQLTMITRILATYNLESSKENMISLLKGLGVGQLVGVGGRYVAGQMVKLIPGAGSLLGGLINGTVATTITIALGYTFSEIGYALKKQQLENPDVAFEKIVDDYVNPELMKDLFQEFYKENSRVQK